MTAGKFCTRCRTLKPIGDFAPSARTRDGLNTYCTECRSVPLPFDPIHPARRNAAKSSLSIEIPTDLKQELVAVCKADTEFGIATSLTSLVCEALEDFLEARAKWDTEA